ncbi:MAG: ABC transporter permease [Hyphomicrobiaceae bacterium]|nr:MAG: ABC transporter permease [Hyphomicrobiaceae bacterium]
MTLAVEANAQRQGVRQRFPTLRRLLRHRSVVIGLTLFLLVVGMALFAELITSGTPNQRTMRSRFMPPGAEFVFGSDNIGRSLYARVVYGARWSLGIGALVVLFNAIFGVILGAAAGYFKHLDNPLMRVSDALMAFPAILLAMGIAFALGASTLTAAIALSAVYIPRTARILRASVLVVREMEYVQAAKAMGASHARILFKHVLPNCLAPLIVQLTFVFAYAVLTEAVLSFLGLGASPSTPTWGIIIAEGNQYLRDAYWIVLFPGLAIALTVLGLNLLGDGLRDVLDPRLKVTQD